jgi:predicted  nucleic acid-binding Zn-ribbon protein
MAVDFQLLEKSLLYTSSYVANILELGKLQAIHDKSNALIDDIQDEVSRKEDSVVKDEQMRALEQVRVKHDEAGSVIQKIESKIGKAIERQDSIKSDREFDTLYLTLSQTLVFLNEVVGKL